MSFSARTPPELSPNPLAVALAARRASGAPIVDLTVSNPTAVGLDYPHDAIAAALAAGAHRPYRPDALGSASARRAVCDYYRAREVALTPERTAITASTSESYGLLFKLLCDPGDEILIPRPSYPLFDHLAAAEAVTAREYRLAAGRGFAVDPDRIEAAAGPRTRAVIVVSPNNPTGTALDAGQRGELAQLAVARGWAIIEDAVFADYLVPGAARPATFAGTSDGPLAFTLGGLSKAAGMPQLKLGWLIASGAEPLVSAALARLELLADAYLSVATPVMESLGALLAAGEPVRQQLAARVASAREQIGRAVAPIRGARLLPADGGWSAVVELPDGVDEEALALRLLERDGVHLYPGYFFDFDRGAHVVLSAIVPPATLAAGLAALVDEIS